MIWEFESLSFMDQRVFLPILNLFSCLLIGYLYYYNIISFRIDLRLTVIELEVDIPVIEIHKGLFIKPYVFSSTISCFIRKEVHLKGILELLVILKSTWIYMSREFVERCRHSILRFHI